MITFILAATLIVLATLAWLVWPLVFTRNTFSYARHAQNIHFAKERLAELEEQLKNASISATDYEALKLEIETTLAQDIDLANAKQDEGSALPKRPNKAAITALCVFLPLGAAAIYTYVGTPEAFKQTQITSDSPTASAEQVSQMVASLEQRLTDSPNDIEGWALLSRTYLALGQFSKAKSSLLTQIELGDRSAETYATLADASALAANGNMAGEPIEYAKKALSINPRNRQALWLSGLAAAQIGDTASAKTHWDILLDVLADQPQQQAELRDIIAEVLGQQALPAQATEKEKENTQESVTAPKGITVNVSIAPQMAAALSPNDALFIIAKAVNGPPAPLAVKRLTVNDLPITVTLSDQDAMLPQFNISSFENIALSARVSKSGQPIAKPGDIQSNEVEVSNTHADTVELKLSELVK